MLAGIGCRGGESEGQVQAERMQDAAQRDNRGLALTEQGAIQGLPVDLSSPC